jgi:hypothetical protein
MVGLSEVCELSRAVPARAYGLSGLKARVAKGEVRVEVHEIPGRRIGFQIRSLAWLSKHVRSFVVFLA